MTGGSAAHRAVAPMESGHRSRAPSVVSVALLLESLRRFKEGWLALPAGGVRRWLVTLLAGFVLACAVAVLMGWATRQYHEAGHLAWEPGFLREIERTGPSFFMAIALSGFGDTVLLAPAAFLAFFMAAWHRRPILALSFVIALFLDLVVMATWLGWSRDRPDVIGNGIAMPPAIYRAFPSGHVAQTASFYGFLMLLWVRASRSWLERLVAVLLFVSVCVAVSLGRLRMGVHWPSDNVAGAFIGSLWAVIVFVAYRSAYRTADARPDGAPGEARA